MRAIFEREKKLKEINELQLLGDDDRLHHLNVVRTKTNDEVMVFDGVGGSALFHLSTIGKKEATLAKKSYQFKEKTLELKLFLANPKKDAFEDILKIAVECGFTEIYPLKTKYSQFDYSASPRFDRLIESALVQSNNHYWPVIHPQQTLESFLKLGVKSDCSLLFTSFAGEAGSKEMKLNTSYGVFIGPEAGFDSSEEEMIINLQNNTFRVHLPSPILRSPTAVAVSSGYIYAQIKKGN